MAKLSQKLDGSIDIPITVPRTKVKAKYNQLLSSTAKTATIKGFRKGKAPISAVAESLDKSKLYQKVLEAILPDILSETIKTHSLKPISHPRLKPISMPENDDWKFTIQIVQFPTFKLGKYKDLVKGALSDTKIWVPGKGDAKSPAPQDEQSLSDKRLKKVFDVLLKNIQVPLASILVDEEVNRALSRLLDQVQKLGLKIEDYVKSLGKTTKSLRTEYEQTAKDNLKLEFILQKIGSDLAIKVTESEVDSMIKAIPDENTRKSYDNPTQRSHVRGVLRKRKTVDALLKLN